MSISDLSLELLQAIISHTLPSGFENFCLTCKSIHRASRMFLPTHNTLRRKYRNFHYPPQARARPTPETILDSTYHLPRCAFELLVEIAENPLIAEYIVHADFKDSHVDAYDENRAFVLFRMQKGIERNGGLRRLLAESTYLPESGHDAEEWFEDMVNQYRAGDPFTPHAEAFLLTLLPNATTLALPAMRATAGSRARVDERAKPRAYWDLLDAITARARREAAALAATARDDASTASTTAAAWTMTSTSTSTTSTTSTNTTSSLSQLAAILPNNDLNANYYNSLDSYDPFLALPRLRTFRCANLTTSSDPVIRAGFKPVNDAYPALRDLELACSQIDSAELREMLSRTPRLRRFAFNYQAKSYAGEGKGWDCDEWTAVVQDCVGASLEEMSLSAYRSFGFVRRRVCTLKAFERLRVLELDLKVLVQPVMGKLGTASWQTCYQGGGGAEGTGEKRERMDIVPRLVDILPASIEKVELLAWTRFTVRAMCWKRLFDRFAEEREAKLPRLEKVTLRYANPAPAAMVGGRHLTTALEEMVKLRSEGVNCVNEGAKEFPVPTFCRQYGQGVGMANQ